jgi:hypothetical protein
MEYQGFVVVEFASCIHFSSAIGYNIHFFDNYIEFDIFFQYMPTLIHRLTENNSLQLPVSEHQRPTSVFYCGNTFPQRPVEAPPFFAIGMSPTG